MTAVSSSSSYAPPAASVTRGLARAASLRELGAGGLILVAYVAATRIGHLQAAKLGIQIGPVPLFLTEIFIITAGLCAAVARPAQIVCWLTTGGLARAPGFLLWMLFVTSVLYFGLAVGEWGILAVRDLAIFAYGIVFAIAYIILDTPGKAAAAMRWFTYSGVILALLLIADTVSGAHVLFLSETRIVTAALILAQSFGGGDVGGIISFSLLALIAYAVCSGERRTFHVICAAICLYAMTITQTRSAVLGIGLGLIYFLFGMTATQRLSFVAVAVGSILTLAAVPILLPHSHLAEAISTLSAAVQGGISLGADDNFYFRLLRWDKVFEVWRDNPLFGAGFGRPLIPSSLLNEAEGEGLGFNAGLPHNTYLTILARLGLFGFVLVMGAWITSIVLATRAIRRSAFGPDAMAAGAALVAMMGFATFVLFLERPMHAANLWIVAAIACRLATPRARLAETPAVAPAWPRAENPIDQARRIARAKGFR